MAIGMVDVARVVTEPVSRAPTGEGAFHADERGGLIEFPLVSTYARGKLITLTSAIICYELRLQLSHLPFDAALTICNGQLANASNAVWLRSIGPFRMVRLHSLDQVIYSPMDCPNPVPRVRILMVWLRSFPIQAHPNVELHEINHRQCCVP